MVNDYKDIIELAKQQYEHDINGTHGLQHWHRVFLNGQLLGNKENINPRIPGLFAFLHDCKRKNENRDPEHGLRASAFIKTLDLDVLQISEDERQTLCYACEYHDKGMTDDNPIIGTCWDADRLDLMRVGIYPDKGYFSTFTAKSQDIIDHCVEQTLTWD